MHKLLILQAICLCWRLSFVTAAFDLGFNNKEDTDLTSFVTRPDLRAPRFNVSVLQPDRITPGYWFLGPYAAIKQDSHARGYLQPCQELVWTGACKFRNQNACDFRAWRSNGSDFISTILWKWKDVEDNKGHGVILNSSFDIVQEVHVPKMMPFFNMHEFNVINDGRTALYITQRPVAVDLDGYDQDFELESGLVADLGIAEIDLVTGETLFEWWSFDHISLSESSAAIADLMGPWPSGWNWIHINAIDKNADGDYLISARYTNGIYKISGKDGSIIWTLSGQSPKFSTFELEPGFNFSRQHDARFVSETETEEVISFLDNGGDERIQTAEASSTLIVTLDKVAKTAKVSKRYIRPGNRRSLARANFQLLPNGNAFSAWSENCHISEHSPDGELLLEAEFASTRFVTYRAWKFPFVGRPSEPPALKTFSYGQSPEQGITIHYVSWNGATEVATWKFYRLVDGVESAIGEKKRTGFETMFQSVKYEPCVIAEGLAADGSVLGRSELVSSIIPDDWEALFKVGGLSPSSCEGAERSKTPVDEDGQAITREGLFDQVKTEL